MGLQNVSYESEIAYPGASSEDSYQEQKPTRTKFNVSMEKKIERVCLESQKLGWSYNDFVARVLEVIVILQHRKNTKGLLALSPQPLPYLNYSRRASASDPLVWIDEIDGSPDLNDPAAGSDGGVISVIRAYVDGSGIDGAPQFCTVAAYVGRPGVWAEWTKKWRAATGPVKSADGAGLEDETESGERRERGALPAKLLSVSAAAGLTGVVIGVDIRELARALDGHEDLKKVFKTPYSACLQHVMQMITLRALQRGAGERVRLIHETNDFGQEAIDAFHRIGKNGSPYKARISLTFASEQDYLPLQAADILAHEAAKRLQSPAQERGSWPLPNQPGLDFWSYGKDNMNQLLQQLEALSDRKLPQPGVRKAGSHSLAGLPNWPGLSAGGPARQGSPASGGLAGAS